jgi:hypothetical protein
MDGSCLALQVPRDLIAYCCTQMGQALPGPGRASGCCWGQVAHARPSRCHSGGLTASTLTALLAAIGSAAQHAICTLQQLAHPEPAGCSSAGAGWCGRAVASYGTCGNKCAAMYRCTVLTGCTLSVPGAYDASCGCACASSCA